MKRFLCSLMLAVLTIQGVTAAAQAAPALSVYEEVSGLMISNDALLERVYGEAISTEAALMMSNGSKESDPVHQVYLEVTMSDGSGIQDREPVYADVNTGLVFGGVRRPAVA